MHEPKCHGALEGGGGDHWSEGVTAKCDVAARHDNFVTSLLLYPGIKKTPSFLLKKL